MDTLSPTISHPILSGVQVRGFKPNPQTFPNLTLDLCQGRGFPASLGRVFKNRYAPRPTDAPLTAGPNSPLSWRYGPAIIS